MKKLVFLLVLIILLSGCVSEKKITEDISYDEKISNYDFNQSYYNETYLELESNVKYNNATEKKNYQAIHIETFAPSTNHKLVIQMYLLVINKQVYLESATHYWSGGFVCDLCPEPLRSNKQNLGSKESPSLGFNDPDLRAS
jgi:hypothetical protein